jgi:hypothetical protein
MKLFLQPLILSIEPPPNSYPMTPQYISFSALRLIILVSVSLLARVGQIYDPIILTSFNFAPSVVSS